MANSARLDLKIDVFEKLNQPALVLPQITPVDLIQSILEEFTELNYLGQNPKYYALEKVANHVKLDNKLALAQQVSSGERLALVEIESSLPAKTQKPSHHLYLQNNDDIKSVYKLAWLPAIIGRLDKNQSFNELVAVNLEATAAGLRVSRRHVQISEQSGNYYVQNLSSNPTSLIKADKRVVEVTLQKQPLQPDDVIHLERSNIKLRFVVRKEI